MKKAYFLLFLVGLSAFSVCSEEYQPTHRVQHDPFQRPAIPEISGLPSEPKTEKPDEKPVWTPKLTATLRAGRNSMANVNGTIIKLGESIDGYRLIEVDERSALFVKNKQRTRLTIDAETNE